MIAIAAGAITVTAIVVAFAAESFDLPWKWLRPGVELLLLAELVGLVVLERHQLFEPVNDKVDSMQGDVSALRTELGLLSQRLDSSGQMTFYANPSQTVGAAVRALREAVAREQEAPQILRIARLARTSYFAGDPELSTEFRELAKATLAFGLVPGVLPDSKVRLWSVRVILTVTSLEHFDQWRADVLPTYWEQNP
jgi:hypothetical protein